MSRHDEFGSPPIQLHNQDRFGCFREAGRDESEVRNEPGKAAGGTFEPANLFVESTREYNLDGWVTE